MVERCRCVPLLQHPRSVVPPGSKDLDLAAAAEPAGNSVWRLVSGGMQSGLGGRSVRVRPVSLDDTDALGLITVTASWGAFIGQIPEASLDLEWTPHASASGWRRTLEGLPPDEFMLVAEGDDGVVGFAWAGLSARHRRADGEVKGLYVLPSSQRRGIGRRLVGEVVRRLEHHGVSSLVIGCIAENPSCDFYRHLGGVEAFRRPNTVDRHQTEEIFFRWSDTAIL